MAAAKLDSQLCFALYSASSRLTSVYRSLLEPLGITYTQFVVLMALWEQDSISISLLADRVGLGKATMTPLLKRLEAKGLIQSKRVVQNERQKNIVLTEKGRQLSDESEAITQQAFCSSGLTSRQANDLIKLCGKVCLTDIEHKNEK